MMVFRAPTHLERNTTLLEANLDWALKTVGRTWHQVLVGTLISQLSAATNKFLRPITPAKVAHKPHLKVCGESNQPPTRPPVPRSTSLRELADLAQS